jgi:chaperone BCS1
MRMFTELSPRSLLLLEDVDINVSTKERTDQSTGVSMSALLQSLDGIVTPRGLITVMTTNRIEALDKALIRPGRADRIFEIGYLTQDQLEHLVENLTGLRRTFPRIDELERTRTTPAEIVEILKHHIGHPATGVEAVTDYVTKKRRSSQPAMR